METYHKTAQEWAEQEFGQCKLGDRRRTTRAVELGAAMLRAPGKTIPQQMQSASLAKAAYRFLGQKGISYQALMKPHWEQTRAKLKEAGIVLLIQDLTEVDYSNYTTIEGLGPIGDGRGRGYLMTTVLSILPKPRQILGIAYQEPFLRQPRPAGETRPQRNRRPKESDFWLRAVQAIGACPAEQQWVHVGDRGSDIYAFLEGCRALRCHFLVRARHDRKMVEPDGTENYVLTFARQLTAADECSVLLPAAHGKSAREAHLKLAFAPLTLRPNWLNSKRQPITAWVIRVWEEAPTPNVEEPIDWYLLTSLPTETVAQAWEYTEWYRCRWLVEEFHQCLKTGCRIEQRRLQSKDSLLRLLGLLSPMAVQLLSLKELSRLEPERPASQVLPADLIRLVAYLAHRTSENLTLYDFWRFVAQQGGYLGRKRDGPPGWKSLWTGWLYIQNLLQGIHLASNFDP